MAEYTIPKPYRDFYVTNPYIELKESNERLQRIVKSGYVATDSFDGHFNQVLSFDNEKHGFSLTNDASIVSTSWSMNFKDASLWEQGSISSVDGTEMSSTQRIRTKDFYPAYNGATYKMEYSSISSATNILIADFYKEDKTTYISSNTYLANNGSAVPNGAYYMRLRVRRDEDITVSSIMDDLNSLTLKITAYTAPSDVTVKVRTCSNLKGASLWRQGRHNVYSSNQNTLITPLPVNKNTTYDLVCNQSSNTYGFQLLQYDRNGNYLENESDKWFYPSNDTPATFTTCDKVETISFNVIRSNDASDFTPEDMDSDISLLVITPNDKMIVNENDTRIVTMPPFTSLYIESNVPYHGHALDLAE